MNGEQQNTTPESISADQARLELAMAAASTERANRPRGLVILALLLFVGAFFYAVSGWFARSATLRTVEAERETTRRLDLAADRVDTLRAKQSSRGLAADPRVGKAIEELASAAGLKADAAGKPLVVPESEVTGLAVPGVAQKKYRGEIKGQDPTAIMQWLVGVQSSTETRGVEISMVTLMPDTVPAGTTSGGWSMTVEFVRWETR